MSASHQDTKNLPSSDVSVTEDTRQREDPDRAVDGKEAQEDANESSVSKPIEENVDLGLAVGTEYATSKHQTLEGDLAQLDQEKSVGQTVAVSISNVIAEIRALQQRVLHLEKQIAQEPRSSKPHNSRLETNTSKGKDSRIRGKDKNLRKLKRKAPHGRRWVKDVEARAEGTTEDRKEFAKSSNASKRILSVEKNTRGQISKNWTMQKGNHFDNVPGSSEIDCLTEDYAGQRNVYGEASDHQLYEPHPLPGERSANEFRPMYEQVVCDQREDSGLLWRPRLRHTEWDTSDTEEWSTDTSTMSRDFDYYRTRLRDNYDRELHRLNAQMRRYRTRKEKKQARQLADEAKVENEETERDFEQIRSQKVSVQRPDTKHNRRVGNHGTPQLNFVDWHTFKASRNTQSAKSFAIDVLIGDPTISDTTRAMNMRGMISAADSKTMPIKPDDSLATRRTASGQDRRRSHNSRWNGQGPLPERIRINSKPIIDILSKFHGKDLCAQKQSCSSVVMLRPFRMLNIFAKDIRELCARLEVDISREPSTSISHGAFRATDHANTFSTGNLRTASTVDLENPPSAEEPIVDPTEKARSLEHLKCLREFIDTYISEKIEYLNSARCEKIVFSDIWYLFTPGTLVISSNGKQAYRVASLRSKDHEGTDYWNAYVDSNLRREKDDNHNDIIIKCVFVDFDGRYLGPVVETFSINKFDDERHVTTLDIYPIRFHILNDINEWRLKMIDDRATGPHKRLEIATKELQDRLIERGRRFVSAATVKYMYYAGLNLDTRDEVESAVIIDFEQAYSSENDSAESRREWRPNISRLIGTVLNAESEAAGRGCNAPCCSQENVHDDSYVETDRSLAFMNNMMAEMRDTPYKLPSVTIFPRPLEEAKTGVNTLTNDELVIMSHSVPGFILRDRSWAKLDVDNLYEIHNPSKEEIKMTEDDLEEDNESAFGQLVLPPGHKMMLLSLISQHVRNKAENRDLQIDIVRGKGKGLVILLHGDPGVGKTTTAECIAEVFNKPLFHITSSDLGSNPREVETALHTNLTLASKWECIVLLEEADVFLAGRKREDFNRNAMVVVFLRALEYYTGILLLTTNRISDFDEAFASRIHLSLHYPEFDEVSSVKVFKLNLKLMKDRLEDRIKIEEDEIIASAREHWRGQKLNRLGWNGRQIRNACQMALALAEFAAQPKGQKYNVKEKSATTIHLRQKHFKVVFNAHLNFTEDVRPPVRGRGVL